jgi:hypothetical protein
MQNATTSNECNTYYYDKRIGMIIWMHAWHAIYDAMRLIQIKRNRNPDTHMVQVILLLDKFKCWLAWQSKERMSYTKLNEVEKPYLVDPNYSTCYLLGEMQTITSQHDARCKQTYGCHIQILHIFLINFYIKHLLFQITVWEIWIKQDWHICRNFRKQKKKLWSGPEPEWRRIAAVTSRQQVEGFWRAEAQPASDLNNKKVAE